MPSTNYLEAFLSKIKSMMPKELFDKVHRMARGFAGGKAYPKKEMEKGAGLSLALRKDGSLALTSSNIHKASGSLISLSLRDDGRLGFYETVEKASRREVRDLLQDALNMKYPPSANYSGAWINELPVPTEGDMVFSNEGKNFLCHYKISDTGVELSDEREAKQVWQEKADAMMADCPKCKKRMEMVNAKEETVDGKPMMVGECSEGHRMMMKGMKKADDAAAVSFFAPILKADAETQTVYSVVADADDAIISDWVSKGSKAADKPDLVDTQGDWHCEVELDTACEAFMANYQQVGKQHKEIMKGARIVQCAVLQKGTAWPLADSEPLKYKAWVMAVKVDDEKTWDEIKSQKITGFSLGGYAEKR